MNWQTFSNNFIKEASKLPKEQNARCLAVLSNLMEKNNQNLSLATQPDKVIKECEIRQIDFETYIECFSNALDKSR